jgi:hypothetical protein
MADRTPGTEGLVIAPNAPGDPQNPVASGQELKVHRFWGRYAQAAQLPNHPGNPATSPAFDFMRQGDVGFVQTGATPGDGDMYYLCDRGTSGGGDAIWCLLTTSGGTAPGHGSIISWGNDTLASSQVPDRFLSPWYDDQVAPTAAIRVPVPAPGVLRNMTILLGIPSASDSDRIRFTLEINGAAPAGTLTVTIPANQAAPEYDNVNFVPVVQGDTMTVRVEKLDGPLSPQPREIFCTFRWT